MFLFRVLAAVTGVTLTVGPIAGQISRPGGISSGGSLGGSSNGSPNGSVGGTTGGNYPSNTNSPFPDATSPGGNTHPIFLSGKVVLDDGTPPGDRVLIESVCAGRRHAEGYTDAKGRFSFQFGQERNVFDDASEDSSGSHGLGQRANQSGGTRQDALQNCDIQASLAGFRSDAISLVQHRYLDNPDLGTIILHRLAHVEGLTISATSALAPKDARKDFEKGLEALKKNKVDEAQKDFEKSVQVYPKYATAWFELGKIHEANQLDEARKAYRQAIEADSKYVNPYERLCILAFKESKWDEVSEESDRIIHLNPYDFPNAYFFNAVANLRLSKLDLAEKSAREAVKLDTKGENPQVNYVLGAILAGKGDFAGAAEYLRAYLKAAPNDPDSDRIRQQLADIEQSAQAKAPAQN